jgi:peptidoglycan glycosyltransferase
MNGPIRRIAIGVFVCMSLLLAGVTWYQVVRADELRNDQRNPRPLLLERGKERGLIVTADGTVLARSVEDPEDPRSFVRQYPESAYFAHLVGYSSFLVGSSGLEGAYAPDLRSRRDLTISDLVAALLGRDLSPNSIEVTVDPELRPLRAPGKRWRRTVRHVARRPFATSSRPGNPGDISARLDVQDGRGGGGPGHRHS